MAGRPSIASTRSIEQSDCRARRARWLLRCRLYRSAAGRYEPPDLVGFAAARDAFRCFGRIDIGGIDDSAGAQIAMDDASYCRTPSHGRMGGRLGISRPHRVHDIAGTCVSRLAQRLGPPAPFRCYPYWYVDSFGALLAEGLARRSQCNYSSRTGPGRRVHPSHGGRFLRSRSLT